MNHDTSTDCLAPLGDSVRIYSDAKEAERGPVVLPGNPRWSVRSDSDRGGSVAEALTFGRRCGNIDSTGGGWPGSLRLEESSPFSGASLRPKLYH